MCRAIPDPESITEAAVFPTAAFTEEPRARDVIRSHWRVARTTEAHQLATAAQGSRNPAQGGHEPRLCPREDGFHLRQPDHRLPFAAIQSPGGRPQRVRDRSRGAEADLAGDVRAAQDHPGLA